MFRIIRLPTALAGLLLAPAIAFADPTLYVCTPTAQVLQVDGASGSTFVLYPPPSATLSGSFHDCVLGPDGLLYIAHDSDIRRINPSGQLVDVLSPGVTPKGLAFNITTLYMTTDTTAVFKWDAVGPANTDSLLTPLDFSQSSPALLFTIGSPGRGVVFDAKGNMILASDSTLHKSPPFPYNSASQLISSGITPFGVAVNTCKETTTSQSGTEIVFADAASKSVRRRLAAGGSQAIGGLTFTGKDRPLYIEIDSFNQMWIVTGEDDLGSNAKIWRANFAFSTAAGGCSTATKTLLVELKTKLNGPDQVLGLLSASGMGIAVAATHKDLEHTFLGTACPPDDPTTPQNENQLTHEYDFGYHKVIFTFTDCSQTFASLLSTTIKLTALKSTLTETTFAQTFPASGNTEGMRYSPMGGFLTQYGIEVVANNPFPTPFLAIYRFFTQETILTPGVARTTADALTAAFDESVGVNDSENGVIDYWDLSTVVDPGERGSGPSKRVVFNSALTQQNCVLTFLEPLASENPLFNGSQVISIKVEANHIQTNQPCTGGTLRVSIFRHVGVDSFEVLNVTSTSSNQVDNIMIETGPGKYNFNFDSSGIPAGTYRVTVWGDIAPFIAKDIIYQQ